MKRIAIALIILVCCQSCGICKRCQQTSVVDSTVIKEITLYRDSTVYYTVVDSVVVAVVRDTSSHLETDMAVSDAAYRDGVLHHSLRNKAGLRPIKVNIPIKATITERVHFETRVEEVEVPAELSSWQRIRMRLGDALLAIAGAAAAYLIFRLCGLK